ncbi:MAG: hypothetical protein RLZZ292_1764 [Bacteroidota bacterium]|jgi:hypothetical protein
MKSVSFFTAITLFSFLAFTACQSKSADAAPKAMAKNNANAMEAKDEISIETFTLWTTNWERNQKNWMADPKNSINYFSMPRVDLGETLFEKPAGTRFYLGLDMTVDPNVIHLIVVGTDSLGHVMLNEKYHAYDVSNACPPVCNDAAKMKK